MSYLPVLIALVFALGLAGALWGLATIITPRDRQGGIMLGRRKIGYPGHLDPFECGNPSTPFRQRFTVKFYAVALLFVLFDVEAVFLYPWAVIFRELGWFGFVEMSMFLGILALGLVWVWRKGALTWT